MYRNQIYKIAGIVKIIGGEKEFPNLYERVANIMKGKVVGEEELLLKIKEVLEKENKDALEFLQTQIEKVTTPTE